MDLKRSEVEERCDWKRKKERKTKKGGAEGKLSDRVTAIKRRRGSVSKGESWPPVPCLSGSVSAVPIKEMSVH